MSVETRSEIEDRQAVFNESAPVGVDSQPHRFREKKTMTSIKLKACLGILALALCAQLPLWADGPQTGTIEGRVLDAQGGALPGVTVTLSGPQGAKTKITDADGKYRFNVLPPGSYTVHGELEGLGEATISMALQAGERRDIDITVRAQTAESITVTAEAPLISKYETASTSTLSAEVTQEVAFSSRAYGSAVHQLPGVTSLRTNNDSTFMATPGGLTFEVGSFIEGVDISQTRRGGEFRFNLPTTATAAISAQVAGVGAEYGRSTSGVINTVIKSGTNNFHGEALYIGQNHKWRAPSEVAPDLPRPDEQLNSWEASLGGPLWRDKAWFFVATGESFDGYLSETNTGFVLETAARGEPVVAKFNVQAGDRHQFSLTGLTAPQDSEGGGTAGDVFALQATEIDSKLYNAAWNFSATKSLFTEVKVADSTDKLSRVVLQSRVIDPGAPPDSPLANNFRYQDLNDGRRYNGNSANNGDGFNDFPREQINVAASLFKGNHEWRFGVDEHTMFYNARADLITDYRGRGYDLNSPSGFTTPVNKRVYESPGGDGISRYESPMQAIHVQDRISIGDRWVVTVGARLDNQEVTNNIGEKVNEYEKAAPRFSAVYDVNADGKVLIRGTAGRTYRTFPLDLAFRHFTRGTNGLDTFDEFGWNSATEVYDVFLRSFSAASDNEIAALDTWFKDEVSLGVDWQFSPNWVLTSRLLWNEQEDLYQANDQYDANGQIFKQIVNRPELYREYQGLLLAANRAFRGGWSLRTDLTVGNFEGNEDDLNAQGNEFEGLGGVQVGTGVLNPTSLNLDGRLITDREYVAHVIGVKRWDIGSHSVVASALLNMQAGLRWGLRPSTAVVHPVSGARINTWAYSEPRDLNQLNETFTLGVAAGWDFPIAGAFGGKVGFEISNVTDEQDQVRVNLRNGRASSSAGGYLIPREFRLKLGITF